MDAGVKCAVKIKTLRALALHCCWLLSSAAVESVGAEATNLREFIFEYNSDSGPDSDSDSEDGENNKFLCNFGVLSKLTELRVLLIQGCFIQDTSLVELCQSLKHLEVLNLHNSKFTDEALSSIHEL